MKLRFVFCLLTLAASVVPAQEILRPNVPVAIVGGKLLDYRDRKSVV